MTKHFCDRYGAVGLLAALVYALGSGLLVAFCAVRVALEDGGLWPWTGACVFSVFAVIAVASVLLALLHAPAQKQEEAQP